MQIDSTLIQKAKEQLGERNAELIIQILGVTDYDSRNMKCCCPFHQEDHASFIYNPKTYNFHCFGACGRSYDILDAYMETGLTYAASCQKLFELAEIPYSFGEIGVQTRRQYQYPKEVVCTDKSAILMYLAKRKIGKSAVDYADVRQDDKGNIVFNYYDTNDVLTMVKYRPARKIKKGENKCWCQPGADTTPLLFNMNRVNTTRPLLITEGEMDALSAIECGYHNVVSVPLGAGNFHWIEENFDFLEQFESIIICADNDDAGIKMQKECVYRLGSWRTKVVQIPDRYVREDGTAVSVKDLNEVLYWFGKEKVLELISDAKDAPVPGMIDFADIEDVDIDAMDGVPTGFKDLDRYIMKLFYGTLNIVTGVNGCVSGDTEYFNGCEWKPISKYRHGEKVAQFTEDGKLQLVLPSKYHVYPAETLFHITDTYKDVDQCVSEEHNLVYCVDGKLIRQSVSDFIGQCKAQEFFHGRFLGEYDIGFPHPTELHKLRDRTYQFEIKQVPALDGKKYCFTVPSGMLVLRHNGRINVTGNSGKSSFLNQVICACLDSGRNAFLFSGELPNFQARNWLNYVFAGQRNLIQCQSGETTFWRVAPEAKRQISEYYRGKLYIRKDGESNAMSDLLTAMEDSVRKYGVKLLILDNMTAINLECSDDGKYEKQAELVMKLIAFAVKYNVAVILVVHPHKIETMRRLSKMDVQGISAIIDLAHRIISLYRVQEKEKKGEQNSRGGWKVKPLKADVVIDILKDRMTGYEGSSVNVYYDKPSKRFFTNEQDLDHCYDWDKKQYDTPLPYPPKQLDDSDESEVFGDIE